MAAKPDYRVFFFGDSLSDSGNYYEAYDHKFSTPPYELVPTYPYKNGGGFTYSNGETWAETFSFYLTSALDGLPALEKPGKYGNYAVGGARARAEGLGVPGHNLGDQVALYAKHFNNTAQAKDLYTIWCGGNDLNDALMAGAQDPSGAATTAIVKGTAEAVANAVQTLYKLGAKKFLVPDAPNISLTPAIAIMDAQYPGANIKANANKISIGYNQALAQTVAQLKTVLPDIKISTFNTNGLLSDMITNPAQYKFENVTGPCVKPGVIDNAICDKPDTYLFWDGLHPTRIGHLKVGIAMLKAYKASQAETTKKEKSLSVLGAGSMDLNFGDMPENGEKIGKILNVK